MRKLGLPDVFACTRLLKGIGIHDDLKALAAQSKDIKDAKKKAAAVWGNGFELLWSIFDKAKEAAGEEQIYAFLSGPFELSVDEIKALDLPAVFEMLQQLARENDLVAFFKRATGSTK